MNRLSLILSVAALFAFTGTSYAATLPTFPSCLNPQGTIKVTHSDGTHGIVGSSNSYSGSDTVYNVLDNSVTQCFCGSDNQGIQTNWFDASNLTQQEIQDLKNDGWFQVPNGLAWGLADKPYMAKNTNYTCSTSRVGGASASNSNSGSSNGSNTILGLASTGNSIVLFAFAFGSIVAFITARILRKSGK
jgi:hypothetical protein